MIKGAEHSSITDTIILKAIGIKGIKYKS